MQWWPPVWATRASDGLGQAPRAGRKDAVVAAHLGNPGLKWARAGPDGLGCTGALQFVVLSRDSVETRLG
jgi:hypothetical protein